MLASSSLHSAGIPATSTAVEDFSFPTDQVYDVLTFRSPGEVAYIQPKGTIFLISTTNPHCMNSAWANLGSETKHQGVVGPGTLHSSRRSQLLSSKAMWSV